VEKNVKESSVALIGKKGNRSLRFDEKYARETLEYALRVLPSDFRAELLRICKRRRDYPTSLCEIHLRAHGRGGIVISGEWIPMLTPVSEGELCSVLDKITAGSAYAYRSELASGYVMLPRGIRVGVCADAQGSLGNIHSLIFRLPLGECGFADELYGLWREKRGGMLLYSPPGCGKTTAMRALVELIARRDGRHVVIADERGEFIGAQYEDLPVDILSGYEKARGIQIAQRTLGAEIIAVDEIATASECEALLRVGFGGVPILATAHAGSRAELFGKKSIEPLLSANVFSTCVRLFRKGSAFLYEVET